MSKHKSKLSFVMTLGLLGACSASEPSTGSLYMDRHSLGAGNVTAEAVAEAHAKDLQAQDEYGVSFLKYWVDEDNGEVYCLARAPSSQAIIDTHRKAHGLLPDRVGPVTAGE